MFVYRLCLFKYRYFCMCCVSHALPCGAATMAPARWRRPWLPFAFVPKRVSVRAGDLLGLATGWRGPCCWDVWLCHWTIDSVDSFLFRTTTTTTTLPHPLPSSPRLEPAAPWSPVWNFVLRSSLGSPLLPTQCTTQPVGPCRLRRASSH